MQTSSEIAIRVSHLDKHFHLYASPRLRIKQYLAAPLRRLFGLPPRQYYTTFQALNDVSFTIHKGESLGILGRNGAGKSTLLQIISGTLAPTHGEVAIHGRVAALLELGSGFNMEFSGRENIVMNCSLLGLSPEQTQACMQAIIDFSEIGDFIDQPVKVYSSGMLMRLAFSVQIAVEPDILIIDEALAVGDVFFMAKCIDFMKTNMRNTTRIFVSHDHAAVANLCDRAIFLDHGTLLMSGTPLACIEAYTRFVHNGGDLKEGNVDHHAEDNARQQHGTGLPKGFIHIPENKRGGKSNIVIKGFRLVIAERAFSGIAYPGDLVTVELLLDVHHPVSEGIIGYFCRDVFGNPLFGETTLSLLSEAITLAQGNNQIASLTWRWPEVKEDNYIFTFGIGSGNDPLFHHIECWCNNILTIGSVTRGKAVHGRFNCPLTEFALET